MIEAYRDWIKNPRIKAQETAYTALYEVRYCKEKKIDEPPQEIIDMVLESGLPIKAIMSYKTPMKVRFSVKDDE